MIFTSTYSTQCGELLITFCNGNSAQNLSVGNQYGSQKNHNFESGLSLIDSTFPRDKLICFPNLNDHTTVSCLTPNSTAAAGPIAWLKKN